MTQGTVEKRFYGVEDVMQVYDVGQTLAEKMIRRVRVLLYPPTKPSEKDNHPLPKGHIYVSDLPVFEDRIRSLKGRNDDGQE